MIIDVDDVKKTIFELNGIKPFNESFTFYYDESGNCRKFYLTDKGFNSDDSLRGDFVLAGVAHKGKSYKIDVPRLYNALDFKDGQKELKFKHLYNNSLDFITFIGRKRTTDFLNWIVDSGLYIHYSTLNNLFYSLVDIVDSLWELYPQCIPFFQDIKSALYDFVNEHQNEVIDIFIKNTYPDVKNVSSFCNELCNLISAYNDEDSYYPGFYIELLRQMLKTAGKLEKLVFVQDNEPFILIKEYYLFYLERCEIFSNSTHIFDEEQTVQKHFEDIQLSKKNITIENWHFVASTNNIYVQVSDLIAGLLRKLFMFLDANSESNINAIALEISNEQAVNFSKIWDLISRSDSLSPLLIKNANSRKNINDRMMKLKKLSKATRIGEQ